MHVQKEKRKLQGDRMNAKVYKAFNYNKSINEYVIRIEVSENEIDDTLKKLEKIGIKTEKVRKNF